MQRTVVLRIIAILLLLLAGAEMYACDLANACVAGRDSGCDNPGGDACLCCCHHIIPAVAFALEPGEGVYPAPPLQSGVHLLSASLPVEHPPRA